MAASSPPMSVLPGMVLSPLITPGPLTPREGIDLFPFAGSSGWAGARLEGPGAPGTALSQFSQSPHPYPQPGLAPRCLCADQWDCSQMLSGGSGCQCQGASCRGQGWGGLWRGGARGWAFLTAPRTKPTPFLVVTGWVGLRGGGRSVWYGLGGPRWPVQVRQSYGHRPCAQVLFLSEVPGKHRNPISSFSLPSFLSVLHLQQRLAWGSGVCASGWWATKRVSGAILALGPLCSSVML